MSVFVNIGDSEFVNLVVRWREQDIWAICYTQRDTNPNRRAESDKPKASATTVTSDMESLHSSKYNVQSKVFQNTIDNDR